MLFFMVLMGLHSSGTGQEEPVLEPVAEVRTHTIESECVGDRYLVRVGLPDGYREDGASYPVVVVLDAEKSFGLVRDVSDWLAWSGAMPNAVVVGISYGTDTATWWRKRGRDLTPSLDETGPWGEWPQSGAAGMFRGFIRDELVPLIEAEYHVRRDWTLVGVSFGGLFATYDMLHEDRLFDRYVVVSPAYPWDDGEIFEVESSYALSHDSLPVTVFTAAGERDGVMREAWQSFNERVADRNYEGLSYTEWLAPDQTHVGVFPGAVSRGLASVFADRDAASTLPVPAMWVGGALALVLSGSIAAWRRMGRRIRRPA
jgi:predicted alpha/beta superfamily hydrolase